MALIINGSTFSGSYNNLSDKPTIPTNTNQLTNGAGFITSAPAPTTSQVLSATASASVGAVGTYATLWMNLTRSPGDTVAASSSDVQYGTLTGSTPSGTWRVMGRTDSNQNEKRIVTGLRIS